MNGGSNPTRTNTENGCACQSCCGSHSIELRDQDNAIGRVCRVIMNVKLLGSVSNVISIMRTQTMGQALDLQAQVVQEIAGGSDIPDNLTAWRPSAVRTILANMHSALGKAIEEADAKGLFNDDPRVWLDDNNKKHADSVPTAYPDQPINPSLQAQEDGC